MLNLYKWTGSIQEPGNYDSAIKAPVWYGSDGTTSFALLETDFATLCSSSEDDLAITVSDDDKAWVKANSREAKKIRKECNEAVRKQFSVDDELGILRTDDTVGKATIKSIVDVYTLKLANIVGD